jgi:hypothetical protein
MGVAGSTTLCNQIGTIGSGPFLQDASDVSLAVKHSDNL